MPRTREFYGGVTIIPGNFTAYCVEQRTPPPGECRRLGFKDRLRLRRKAFSRAQNPSGWVNHDSEAMNSSHLSVQQFSLVADRPIS
jgi:hypothetical protein